MKWALLFLVLTGCAKPPTVAQMSAACDRACGDHRVLWMERGSCGCANGEIK